jgi:hypothetical protein
MEACERQLRRYVRPARVFPLVLEAQEGVRDRAGLVLNNAPVSEGQRGAKHAAWQFLNVSLKFFAAVCFECSDHGSTLIAT